jgi:hypothetical protein
MVTRAWLHSLVREKEMTRGSDALEHTSGEAAPDQRDRAVRARRDTIIVRGEMYSA